MSKDVFDQIRDLESFIDDFAAETTDISDSFEHDEKTQVTSPTIIYQKPNEKTLVEEEQEPVVEEKVLVAAEEEKVLVETPTSFSMLDYKLNLSDDFSSLVTQFNQLTVSPVEATPKKREPTIKQIVEPIIISASDSQPQPQNRRNSVSSKKSQKSTKSVKSAKSFKSARKHVNKQQRPKEKPKYIPRSYDEMMRIPDIYERISFYDKTLDLCLKAESPITKWSSSTLKKGKPQAVVDGYSRDLLLSGSTSCLFSPEDSIKNASTTFGSSISLFLKKATSTQSFQQPSLQQKSSSPYPQTSHGLFGRSMSRFQLSRSTQLPPKHDNRILLNNRVSHTKPRNLSPLSTLPPIQTSASTPTKVQDGLAYMMNILPQIDVKILQSALDEAHGDPMEAITIAVSKNKSSSMLSHDTVPRKKKHMKKFR